MTVAETLASLVERFNAHAARTPSVQAELAQLSRTVVVRLTDEASYSVELREGRLQNLRTGVAEHADLTITTDRATFEGLVRKEVGPMKAIVLRKLTIDGRLEDKLLFRKLL